MLLAIDVGVRCGFALFGADGRLVSYRSRNFGSGARLRKAVPGMLGEIGNLTHLVLEGGGPLADVWAREAARRDAAVIQTCAEEWRELLLPPKLRRTGADAKRNADALARRVIEWSGAPRPTSLRHDAAEAILTGLWGVIRTGWLPAVPASIG